MSQQETLASGPLTIASASSPNKPLTGADPGRAHPEAVFLEVPVRIHGSRVLEVVRGITPYTEQFEEQAVTMIVFPGGGVVRMRTAMHADQVVVVTNLKSGQDAIGRVSKVRPCGNQQVYVEVEFTAPQPGFWGVEFLSERSEKEANAGTAALPIVAPTAAFQAPPAARVVAPIVEARTDEKVISSVAPAPTNSEVPPASQPPAAVTAPAPAAFSATARVARPASAFVSIGESEEVQPAATETSGFRRDRSSKRESAIALAGAPQAAAPVVEPSSSAQLSTSLGSSEDTKSFDRAREESPDASAGFGTRSTFGTFAGAGQYKEGRRSWVLIVTCAALLMAAGGGGAAYWVNQQLAAELPTNPLPVEPAPPAEMIPAQDLAAPPVAQSNGKTSLGGSAPHGAEAVHADVAPSAVTAGASGSTATPPNANKLSQSKLRAAVPEVSGTVNASPVASREGTGAGGAAAASLDVADGAGKRGGEPAVAAGSPATRPRVSQALALDTGVTVRAPRLISETKPVYPVTAQQAGADGNVVVRIVIDKAGNVVDARAVAGPEILLGAALDAVRQWRYEPSMLNGRPVPVQMQVTIPFSR